MPVRKKVIKISFVAVALGFAIFFVLGTSPPSFFDLAPGLARSLQALYAAGHDIRNLAFGGRASNFDGLGEERIRILAGAGKGMELERENALLRQALGLRDELGSNTVPADIAGFFREGRDEFILINRGRTQGLESGWLVVDSNKILAGTIQDLGNTTAKVKLLTSPSSAIEVVILSPKAGEPAPWALKALARGDNIRELKIDLVPQGAVVGAGDLVFFAPGRDIGSAQKFLAGEVREAEAGGNEVFLPVRALHLFDPFSAQAVFVLVPH